MKSIITTIKENTEYKDYTCYFSKIGKLDNPRDGFLTAFIEEYLFFLFYQEYISKDVIKTNEHKNMVNSNLSHCDIKTKKSIIDIKSSAQYESSISLKDDLDKEERGLCIGCFTKNQDDGKTYIVVNDYKYLINNGVKRKSKNNKGYYYTCDYKLLLKKPKYQHVLDGEYATNYKNLKPLYNNIEKINYIPAGSNIKIFRDAADEVLKELTPVFQQEFGLTPKIEFV